jgi:hypothetical protein
LIYIVVADFLAANQEKKFMWNFNVSMAVFLANKINLSKCQ